MKAIGNLKIIFLVTKYLTIQQNLSPGVLDCWNILKELLERKLITNNMPRLLKLYIYIYIYIYIADTLKSDSN